MTQIDTFISKWFEIVTLVLTNIWIYSYALTTFGLLGFFYEQIFRSIDSGSLEGFPKEAKVAESQVLSRTV